MKYTIVIEKPAEKFIMRLTLNVYAHTSEQMRKDTAARMQSYYDGRAGKG